MRVWSGTRQEQEAARAVGLTADRGRLMLGSLAREAELEEVTDALVLTPNDDFNNLAAAELRQELGHGRVFRPAPDPERGDLAPPPDEAGIIAGEPLTAAELGRRFERGARLVQDGAGRDRRPGPALPLLVVTRAGQIRVVTPAHPPDPQPGDTVIALADGEPVGVG